MTASGLTLTELRCPRPRRRRLRPVPLLWYAVHLRCDDDARPAVRRRDRPVGDGDPRRPVPVPVHRVVLHRLQRQTERGPVRHRPTRRRRRQVPPLPRRAQQRGGQHALTALIAVSDDVRGCSVLLVSSESCLIEERIQTVHIFSINMCLVLSAGKILLQ